ncbi:MULTISPECIES: DUF58 domain-containing protein [Rhizobium]|uniref:DUF58 domain-containing protein n=1 Tax=Rhizobium leguminosarum bv. viciae TaxID=387 RepID=A0A8G2MS88_RHILV|nr:DUF58 domain-containing protein [Rhizobium leguminosarum]MBY5425145.1 DUF58 domain-containing protein [Rhizobium leguminosarum]NKK05437.1 DUF58 domain-containing protein [Rhizobium leguminosarum bv. viciae]NKK19607.1 DUF58 domain-containing protein [Rhizobium leguminosarum bv. viciae]TBX96875.1 DUF58 domain-containing protein [Rhizobium leguminosarum bv. viciae]TBZ23687.1 DUF58 domain-containing protein [Rhizobium leguminosarum bv. viciae]
MSDAGVYVSTDELVALEARARDLSFVQKARSHQQLAGRMQSAMRGRGLIFEELRDYLPGDDIRSIDWRVTARTSRPVVRVYSEEKERPALIIVDQRINMFFGSRRSMKSVTAAEAAMLCAWRILGSGDRVGGFVFGESATSEVKPHRSRNAVIAFAEKIARQNASLRADSKGEPDPQALDTVLSAVANIAHHDHLVVIVSDFDGHTATTRDILLRLSSRNDVICLLVYDPFLLELPTSGDIVVSGGGPQAELALRTASVRSSIDAFARNRGRELRAWQRQLGLPMLPISAAEETAPQLRRLLEQSAWRQRRR